MKMLNGLGRQLPMVGRNKKRAGASKSQPISACSLIGRVRSLHSGEEGQAILETTLCLVFVLLPLVFGMFFFGLYIAYYQDLTQAVGAAGVRVGSDRGNSLDPCADALTTMNGASPLVLTPANLTLTVTFNGTTLGGKTCANASLGSTYGGTAVVSASYIIPCPVPAIPGLKRVVCQPVQAQVTEYVY
jgi:TadE-like protein